MDERIKVGLLMAYDYAYLKKSIPCIYAHADQITIAVDVNRKTWSGNTMEIPQDIFEWIEAYDTDKKIKIYEDNFYDPNNTAVQNDTMQRNMMARFMGEGGWHILIDADEYFVNFKDFVTYLKSKNTYLSTNKPVQVLVFWVTLFKKVAGGYLYIKDSYVPIEVATNKPHYKYCRITPHTKRVFTKFYMIHQSWARDEREIWTKVSNWSEKDHTDVEAFVHLWKSIDKHNYKELKNFHGTDPKKWKALDFVADDDLHSLALQISDFEIFKQKCKKTLIESIRNTVSEQNFNRLRKLFNKMTTNG